MHISQAPIKPLVITACTFLLVLAGILLCANALASDREQLQARLNSLSLPAGFKISIFAAPVKNARQMALGDRGTVFVGSRAAGRVYALLDADQDGYAEQRYLIDSGLDMPSGVAFRDGDLYVAAVNQIRRYNNIESRLMQPPKAEIIIDDLPSDAHHGWKAIRFDHRGQLFIPVGVPCNICRPEDERYGTILKLDLKTLDYTIFAKGVRNSVGLAFHPQDQSLWFTDNGRDWLGDDLPADEINRAHKPGLHFGFPYLHGRNTFDRVFAKAEHRKNKSRYSLPEVELGAHVAPLGLMFYNAGLFPRHYHQGLFVAEHGSWNRSRKTGYRVIYIPVDKQGQAGAVEPFISGWLDKARDDYWGRPVDVMALADGSLLISDDYADLIYRVSYNGSIKRAN